MKKAGVYSLLTVIIIFLLSSCLTVEKKEYCFEFTGKNSGILTIKYVNIVSMMDDSTDNSEDDFNELIKEYYNGAKIEDNYPGAKVISKRLFEENNILCGEIKIEFSDLASARLYQNKENEPYTFSIEGTFDYNESYIESNGTFGGEIMPVVFWSSALKKLKLSTLVVPPDESNISLIDRYRKWKGSKK